MLPIIHSNLFSDLSIDLGHCWIMSQHHWSKCETFLLRMLTDFLQLFPRQWKIKDFEVLSHPLFVVAFWYNNYTLLVQPPQRNLQTINRSSSLSFTISWFNIQENYTDATKFVWWANMMVSIIDPVAPLLLCDVTGSSSIFSNDQI